MTRTSWNDRNSLTEEAADIYLDLQSRMPDTYRGKYRDSLATVAGILTQLGSTADAHRIRDRLDAVT